MFRHPHRPKYDLGGKIFQYSILYTTASLTRLYKKQVFQKNLYEKS